MRFARLTIVLAGFGGVAFVVGPGCRDATQVTVEITLAKRALCTETSGTAITVGVEALETEDRVRDEYVTATTSSCDPTTQMIGTLVLTPSDAGHASVIVVVGYGGIAPATCKPPLYKGCVVARRQFAFADHKHLRMPITIDPNCKDVPCDAFSTCRTGACFPANAAPCDGDECLEPGATPDGGTNEAGAVIPDTGVPNDGPSPDGAIDDGGADSSMPDAADAADAGDADDGSVVVGPGSAYCLGPDLHCPSSVNMADVSCQPTLECCLQSGPAGKGPVCGAANSCTGKIRYCCTGGVDYCGAGMVCNMPAAGGSPGGTVAGACGVAIQPMP